MGEIFFTADTHFNHANIINFSGRPFADKKEMDAYIAAKWNSAVGINDTVYHLGDVYFSTGEDISRTLGRLNGVKYLIPGNHDDFKKMKILENYFEILPQLHEIKVDHNGNTLHLTLCHYPLEVWNRSHKGSFMLHGHTHGRIPDNSQRLDVGIDCWRYTPIDLTSLLKKFSTLPDRICKE